MPGLTRRRRLPTWTLALAVVPLGLILARPPARQGATAVDAAAVYRAYAEGREEADRLYRDRDVAVSGEWLRSFATPDGGMGVLVKAGGGHFLCHFDGPLDRDDYEATLLESDTVAVTGRCAGWDGKHVLLRGCR